MLGYVPIISGNWWHSLFQKILLFLDSVVYWAVSMCYQLFVKLATFRLFDDSFFSEFANRIYSILGVFMLFYLAYALLNALITGSPVNISRATPFNLSINSCNFLNLGIAIINKVITTKIITSIARPIIQAIEFALLARTLKNPPIPINAA